MISGNSCIGLGFYLYEFSMCSYIAQWGEHSTNSTSGSIPTVFRSYCEALWIKMLRQMVCVRVWAKVAALTKITGAFQAANYVCHDFLTNALAQFLHFKVLTEMFEDPRLTL